MREIKIKVSCPEYDGVNKLVRWNWMKYNENEMRLDIESESYKISREMNVIES